MPDHYRGSLGGRAFQIRIDHPDGAAIARWLAKLEFAGLQPAAAPGSPEAGAVTIAVAVGNEPPAAAASATATVAWPLDREIAAGIRLQLDWARRQARFVLAPASAAADWPQRLADECLHLFGLFTGLLALHASAVVAAMPGAPAPAVGGWVFCGPSGAGKTTLATQVLKDFPLIGEEIVLLDPAARPLRILNAPAADRPLPVAGLLQLQQAPQCALQPLSPSEFIAKNMTRPFDLNLPQFLEERLEKLARVTATIRPQTLQFNLDPAAVRGVLGKISPPRRSGRAARG